MGKGEAGIAPAAASPYPAVHVTSSISVHCTATNIVREPLVIIASGCRHLKSSSSPVEFFLETMIKSLKRQGIQKWYFAGIIITND